MNTADWPEAVFDQSGQLVDLQYNASKITIVNNLTDGANGKQCPKCKASPMARTQLVWEEGTRRQRHGLVLLNAMARRAAPPGKPSPPSREQVVAPEPARRPYKVTAGAVVCSYLVGLTVAQPSSAVLGLLPLLLPGATLTVAAALLWNSHRTRRRSWDAAVASSEEQFAQDWRAYSSALQASQRRFQQWKESWFCRSCSAIVAEDRAKPPSPRRPATPPDKRVRRRT